ncbi:DUF6006 family protein [Acaryochloris thomasi]|uniref:DUF6006 family protein n=1 Tax=Acaryochloris thomasi TaxID=2929456 RepID=UPI0011B835F3|nr:DUF6006 family protein [Acaryochloris thomasi]
MKIKSWVFSLACSCISLSIFAMIPTPTSANINSERAIQEWSGNWDCIIDGRPSKISFNYDFGKGWGIRFSDNGGPWKTLVARRLDSNDPPADRPGNLFPLKYADDGNHWLLILHGGSRKASGYTTWNKTPYGLHCQK